MASNDAEPTSITIMEQPPKLEQCSRTIGFIDEDEAVDEQHLQQRQQEEGPSSSTLRQTSDPYGTFPLPQNGGIAPFPDASSAGGCVPERKRTLFKISRATLEVDVSGGSRKHSWLEQRRQLLGEERKDTAEGSPPQNTSPSQPQHCPFAIWREKFLREHQCRRQDMWREVLHSALPHLVVFLTVCLYVTLGAVLFRQLDPHMGLLPFHDVLLFAFTTITTIGYGNIVPQSTPARLACALYCLVGIPLVFLTLANLGELLADCYWVGVASLKGQKDLVLRDEISRLPLKVVVLLLLLHSLLGGLIFHFWIQHMEFFPAVYFSFISITTIGFGDLSPEPRNMAETVAIMAYLASGIAIMSTLFNTLSEHLRRLHYLGRDFPHARDVRVWFGGARLSVRELVALVAERFDASPQRLREVLDELDSLVRLASPSPPPLAQRRFSRRATTEEDGDDADAEAFASVSPTSSSITSEQQQMIQALGALHRLTVKGTRTFHTPSLNSLSLIRSAPAALLTSTVNDAHKRRQSEQQQRQPQKRERKRTTTSRSLPMAAENRQQIT